jgi:hypothetical protein
MWQVVSGIGALPRWFAIRKWRQQPSQGGGFQSTDLTIMSRVRAVNGGAARRLEHMKALQALSIEAGTVVRA